MTALLICPPVEAQGEVMTWPVIVMVPPLLGGTSVSAQTNSGGEAVTKVAPVLPEMILVILTGKVSVISIPGLVMVIAPVLV
jgi:hypothetical protein